MADKAKKTELTETHPNPHGEQTVAAVENRMNPSVTSDIDPTDDSMFNNADPQTRELQKKEGSKDRTVRPSRQPKAA